MRRGLKLVISIANKMLFEIEVKYDDKEYDKNWLNIGVKHKKTHFSK